MRPILVAERWAAAAATLAQARLEPVAVPREEPLVLRLLADDLTGALDSAAPFAATRGALPVVWSAAACRLDDGDLACSTETRDADRDTAAAIVRAFARRLGLRAATIAFKKIDSCLRGQPAAEIAAVVTACGFRSAVVAPAFPRQGRITRAGRQWVKADGHWRDAGVDLAAALAEQGLAPARTSSPSGAGIFVCDAGDDRDLVQIAASGPALAMPVLWCGAGGLARALAGAEAMLPVGRVIRPPVVLLIGTGHPVTQAQRAVLPSAVPQALSVEALQLAPGTAAEVAGAALERLVARLADAPPPATLVVAGGETLMRLCRALGATRLAVVGELEPGVPVSTMAGGRWSGTTVVSKSGGFGDREMLLRVLAPAFGCDSPGSLS